LKKQQSTAGITTVIGGIVVSLFSALFLFIIVQISLYGFQF
jgi:hypothetical protein